MQTRFCWHIIALLLIPALSFADNPWERALAIDSVADAEYWQRFDDDMLQQWIDDGLLGPNEPGLNEKDCLQAAKELNVEPAAIHAVIEIEAGPAHQGFWAPGKPIVNCSLTLFAKYAKKRGVKINKYKKSHPAAFGPLNRAKYGSYQAAMQARLDQAMDINEDAAIEATYWGMFQIGGFNWRLCGASSPHEFAQKMQASEKEQLELFVKLLKTTGMDVPLQSLDWTQFARKYNGAAYAKRKYHKRLAQAYKKYKEKY